MKVFVDIQKECQIGKIDDEGRALFKGDVNADILKIYFKHTDGMPMNWFLTISGILPNGRPIAPTDHDGILGSEIIDGVEWKYYQFTLSKPNGFNLMKGLVTMYVRINYTNSDTQNPKVIKEKTIAVINANVVETAEYNDNLLLLGNSIEEVVFNFKQQIENLAAKIASDNDINIVNYLQVLSRVLSHLIPSENEAFNLGNLLYKWLTLWVKIIQADQVNVVGGVNSDLVSTYNLNVLSDNDKEALAQITKAIITTLEADNVRVKQNVNVSGIVDATKVMASNIETTDFLTTNAKVNERLYAKGIVCSEGLSSPSAIITTLEADNVRVKQNVNVSGIVDATKVMASNIETTDFLTTNAKVNERLYAKGIVCSEGLSSPSAIIDGLRSINATLGDSNEFSVNATLATYRGVEIANQNDINTRVSNDTFNNRLADLQSQIDGINAGQNLADIVGTYALLLSYDTSNLNVNDKIQVLKDETKEDDSTIYNWNGSAFEYVGSYSSNVYTKAETETKLAQKQNTLTAGDGVTIVNDTINMDLNYYLGETDDVDNSVVGNKKLVIDIGYSDLIHSESSSFDVVSIINSYRVDSTKMYHMVFVINGVQYSTLGLAVMNYNGLNSLLSFTPSTAYPSITFIENETGFDINFDNISRLDSDFSLKIYEM